MHLVEDDPIVRTMLTRLLESGGYSVRQYTSGSELLEAAPILKDGLILLDIDMPEPDGFAVQRQLTEQAIDLPVVMMSGSGDLTVLAMKAGVTEFMQKPFDRSELLSILDQLPSKESRA